MIRRRRNLIWLFLLVLLTGLFVYRAALPHRWERAARKPATAPIPQAPPITQFSAQNIPGSRYSPPFFASPVSPTADHIDHFRPVEPPERIAERAIAPALPEWPSLRPAPAVQDGVAPVVAGESAQQQVVPSPDDVVADSELRQPPAEQRPPRLEQSPLASQPPLVALTPSPLAPFPRQEPRLSNDSLEPNKDLRRGKPVVPPPTAPVATPAPVRNWQEPKALLDCLGGLKADAAVARWAAETARLVRELGAAIARQPDQCGAILQRLEQAADQVASLAGGLEDRGLARKVGQAGYALRRRLAVWQELVAASSPAAAEAEVPQADFERLSLCLSEINSLTAGSPEGQAWREYLLVDALRECAERRQSAEVGFPPEVAQAALKRLRQAPLSVEQREFVAREPLTALEGELRRLAAEPVDRATLLAHLEQYEQTRLPADARLLARDCQSLAVSPSPQCRQLGRQLETHYRNANLRLAISEQLLNRLMPEQNLEYTPIRETVLGMPVYGESLTSSEVAVRLLPDANRVRLALEISGEIASLTSAASGPARFVNRGTSRYVARKPMEVDLQGIHVEPAEVQVSNETRLRNLETDFDNIPLVGALAKGIARSQHEQNRPAANREVKRKVAGKARQRVDAETGQRLGTVSQRLHQQVLEPLYGLSLDPTIINAETSQQRVVMRLRLAGEDQLGSHTPRPQAPGDSLASFQLHETVLNNALARLELEGKTFTLPQLSQHVAIRFGRLEPWEVNPEHDDVAVTFAERNAVDVRCQDGQVVLTLAIARLSNPPRSWKNFQARAFYRPEVNGRSAELLRDGVIHLIGQRLDLGSRIALQGIFARALPRKTPWNLTPERLATDPALADLAISQFTIDDGWIAVALSSKRTAMLPGLLRR